MAEKAGRVAAARAQENAKQRASGKGVLSVPLPVSTKGVRRLPPHIHAHSIREAARTIRVLSGELEVAVIAKADLDGAVTFFRAIILELERMRIHLGIEL